MKNKMVSQVAVFNEENGEERDLNCAQADGCGCTYYEGIDEGSLIVVRCDLHQHEPHAFGGLTVLGKNELEKVPDLLTFAGLTKLLFPDYKPAKSRVPA